MEHSLSADEVNAALLILRVVVGLTFAFHGYAKITRGGKLAGTAAWFDSMGMRPGHLHARFAAYGELATGASLVLGFLTPLGGLGLVALMFVAFWTVHRGNGLLVTGNGWEYNLVLATIGVALAMLGPGEWSVDDAIGLDLFGNTGLAIALLGGLAASIGLLAAVYRPPAPTPGDGEG